MRGFILSGSLSLAVLLTVASLQNVDAQHYRHHSSYHHHHHHHRHFGNYGHHHHYRPGFSITFGFSSPYRYSYPPYTHHYPRYYGGNYYQPYYRFYSQPRCFP
ncbi:MAG: hypothetical protein KatS3mg105_4223 [Gemmatales bacterium]|nr:MAG: hypothetical protein KatS3mg105_4223 [Gemmatales bacterium]